jgi:hypothetical protein
MIKKATFFGVGLCALLLIGMTLASAGSAAKAKPTLVLKEKGVAVPNGTKVGAGWDFSAVTHEVEGSNPVEYTVYGCEIEGKETLTTNGSTTTDKATGTVGAPDENCGAVECVEESEEECVEVPAAASKAFDARGRHARRHHRKHRSAARSPRAAKEKVKITSAEFIITSVKGTLTGQEMTVKHKGAFTVSPALVLAGTEAGQPCSYESKPSFKAVWPVEEAVVEYLTADLEAEADLKLVKGSNAVCRKTMETYFETWLGPDFAELEAELT